MLFVATSGAASEAARAVIEDGDERMLSTAMRGDRTSFLLTAAAASQLHAQQQRSLTA